MLELAVVSCVTAKLDEGKAANHTRAPSGSRGKMLVLRGLGGVDRGDMRRDVSGAEMVGRLCQLANRVLCFHVLDLQPRRFGFPLANKILRKITHSYLCGISYMNVGFSRGSCNSNRLRLACMDPVPRFRVPTILWWETSCSTPSPPPVSS